MSEQNKQKLAFDKLDAELKKAKEKDFAEPIVEYLKKRIADDEGLAEDVLKADKTWAGCFNFIFTHARKLAGGKKSLGVRNDVVFEWAEDYFRNVEKDPAAGKKNAKKTKSSTKVTKTVDNVDKSVDKISKSVSAKPKKAEKPKKQKPKKEDMSGQMSIFDYLGGLSE